MPPIIVRGTPIAYADSSEAPLLERFSGPQEHDEYSVTSHDMPWALHYHLTPRRKSLLSWMDFGPDANILELGAGCGALTSLLVERASSVTAVEGSLDRARVIQQRCRNATNLRIVVGNAADLSYEGEFTHVILVGVLEYAQAYVPHPQPHAHLLAQARRCLQPNGCLVLAIENTMGHKYLAGMPEDHTGRPYCGVNGYPGPFAARTFDRPTLETMLTGAGLSAQAWFYPSPDYKTPDTILSEAAFRTPGFNPLPLLDLPTQDYGKRIHPAFNERAFLASTHRGAIAPHFMNSFLVLAAANPEASPLRANANMLASALNADGCPRAFQTMTRFDSQPDGTLRVSRRNLHGSPPLAFSLGEQRIKPGEKYLSGYVSILERILDLLEAGDQTGAGASLLRWIELLSERAGPATPENVAAFEAFCRHHLGQSIYAGHMKGPWIPGALLDAHPGNVLFHPETKDVRFIDLEWRLFCALPLQLIIDRGVNLVAQKIALWQRYYFYEAGAPGSFPPGMTQRLNQRAAFRQADVPSLARFQTWLTACIRSGNMDHSLEPLAAG
ncbi:MAG: class I SAM-dependent methyltransferase [Humidesulfovibrio sp.]|nr:class I SAM-dependent methyltransferase [Humidesulfovibrio sp.]